MSSTAGSDFDYDPFSKAVMANPHPFYQTLRDRFPVYFIPKYDAFVFSRFEDIWNVLLQGNGVFIANESTLPTPEVLLRHNGGRITPLAMDPLPMGAFLGSPHFEDLRQAFMKPLRPRSAAALEGFIRNVANQALDDLLPKKIFDLTQDYGGAVSASVICELFGLHAGQAREVLETVNAGTKSDPEKGGVDTEKLANDIIAIILPIVRARRAAGADGSLPIVDGMVNYRVDGRKLRDDEVAIQLVGVFIGGTETVPKIAAHGLLELAQRPDQLAAVRADLSANVPVLVEEMVRYCGPAQWFARTAHKETIVAGQKIGVGQRVICLFGSAARDEREFHEPDEFVWNRRIARTLSFGLGQHHCAGIHIARLELRILVEEFLRRVPEYHFDMAKAVRLPSSFQWGWNSLPVIVEHAQ